MDELIKRSTVRFNSLSLAEFEKMLAHISTSMPAAINYRAAYFKNISPSKKSGSRSIEDLGTVEAGGMIRSLKDPMVFDSFSTIPYEKNTSKIAAIRFNLIPGYDLRDYRPEAIKLWQEVRVHVHDFFS